jgi:hypothetical protein
MSTARNGGQQHALKSMPYTAGINCIQSPPREIGPKSEIFSFLDGIAFRSVQKHVQRTIETKTVLIGNINSVNRALKDQKKLLTKEELENMDAAFKNSLAKHAADLKVQGVNLSLVESSLDYKKLYGSGGAAESTRDILAYYIAVLLQIYNADSTNKFKI